MAELMQECQRMKLFLFVLMQRSGVDRRNQPEMIPIFPDHMI